MEEFDITEYLEYYMSKIIIVVLCVLLGMLISWYYTVKIQVPLYKSETSIVLANQNTDITVNDVSLNKNLLPTYREIIKSRSILEKVIANLNLNLTVEDLSKKINVKSQNDAEIIVITVKDEEPKVSQAIANEIAKIFKEEITKYYPIENVTVLDSAVEADEAYNIDLLKQYLIGVGLGFLIGSGIVTTVFYFDDTIKTSEDIETKVGLNVLSTVPRYKPKKKKEDE